MRQTWNQVLIAAETDGAALANSTTATSLLPTAAVFTIPSNVWDIGVKLRVTAGGRISTTATPTITFTLMLAGASWIATQAITTGSGITNLTWKLQLDITTRAIGNGTSANAMFTGFAGGIASATAMTMIPASAPAVSSGFNSVQANTLDLFGTWSAASASNTITLHEYAVESMN